MPYEYSVELLTEEGRQLDCVGLAPDWQPALEWVRFEGIRAGRLPAVTAAVSGVVEPVWDGRAGEPIVAAFRAVVRTAGGDEVAREIPKTYVDRFARRAAAKLVERGVLQAGDAVRYVISAFPGPKPDAPLAHGVAVGEIWEPRALGCP